MTLPVERCCHGAAPALVTVFIVKLTRSDACTPARAQSPAAPWLASQKTVPIHAVKESRSDVARALERSPAWAPPFRI
jgi:hypothetical protein